MPRQSRRGTANYTFHVFNRSVQGLTPFELSGDYDAFLRVLNEGVERWPTLRLLGYAVMPTHWHLVTWPADDESLSRCMHWMTGTHARRWRESHGSAGRGALYQSRFKAIPVQEGHLLRLMRYVERNPVTGRCVARVADWPWTSAGRPGVGVDRPPLAAWPVPRPPDWPETLEIPLSPADFEVVRKAIRTGMPLGEPSWQKKMLGTFHWLATGRQRGRPRRAFGAEAITEL
ncbi:MAG: transposase [Bacteroidales bacterium]